MLSRKTFLTISLVWLFTGTALLAKDESSSKTQPLKAEKNTPVRVEDRNFGVMNEVGYSKNFTDRSLYNSVAIRIDFDQMGKMKTSFTVKAKVSVVYYLFTGSNFTKQTKSDTLRLSYSNTSGTTDQDISMLRFKGGYAMDVTVDTVFFTSSDGSFPGNIVWESRIDADRVYDFNPTAYPKNQLTYIAPPQGSNELEIQWHSYTGAEYYDLEWTWVNNIATNGSNLPMSSVMIPAHNFKYNSTRVSVGDTSYKVPLLYESGFLLYRLRAVGISLSDGKYIAGRWTSEETDSVSVQQFFDQYGQVYTLNGHEQNLNWQRTTSYAEEGKNKVAVSYFDGTLRNRQIVSRLNTENRTIVGETIYDHQGRAAIKVLPVPTTDSIIRYYAYFNLNDSSISNNRLPYHWTNFELDSGCGVAAGPMSTLDGASRYYSPYTDMSISYQQYLPDAKKYPFSQTQYTPDNTGRIKRQGGVGPDHQLTNQHETRYMYGKPDKTELDRLFGSEVGYSSHYKKNATIDANGQISLSYIDLSGKTIATALAGEKPASVDSLDSYKAVSYTTSLLDDGNNVPNTTGQEATVTLNQPFMVTTAGTRTFNYTATPGTYTPQICSNGQFNGNNCYNCVFDIEMSLMSECRDELFDTSAVNNTTMGTFDTIACGTQPYTQSLTTMNPLKVGTYSLVKKLTLNQEALDEYTNQYFRDSDCLLTLNDFLDSAFAHIDTTDCERSCQACEDSLARDYPIPDPNNPDYAQRKQYCEDLCQPQNTRCLAPYKGMLADVSPNGQYGKVYKNNPQTQGDSIVVPDADALSTLAPDTLSVYNLDRFNYYKAGNLLPRLAYMPQGDGTYEWTLVDPAYNSSDITYLDDNGSVSMVRLEAINGTYPDALDPTLVDDIPGTSYGLTKPNNLALGTFVDSFRQSWAEALVVFHPEFPNYALCQHNDAANQYISDFMNENTLSGAKQKSYVTSDGKMNLTADPLFSASNDPYYYEQSGKDAAFYQRNITNDAANYQGAYSVEETAYIMVNCPGLADQNKCGDLVSCGQGRGVESDSIWQRYKPLYYSLRQQQEEELYTRTAKRKGYDNTCIGNDYYSPFLNGFYEANALLANGWNGNTLFYWFLNEYALCSYNTYPYYKNRTPRWPVSSATVSQDILGVDYCSTDTSGYQPYNCPKLSQRLLDEGNARNLLTIYQDCGQCPVTFNLEQVLNGIAESPWSFNQDFDMDCSMSQGIPEFTSILEDALDFTATVGAVSWKFYSLTTTPASGGQYIHTLQAAFIKGDTTITGNKRPITLNITTDSPDFDPTLIKTVCCLNYQPISGHTGFSFDFNIKYKTLYGTQYGLEEQYNGTGWTDAVRLDTCSFPAVCKVIPEGMDLQDLMNAVAFDFGNGTGINLLNNSNVDLNQAPYQYFITDELKTLLGTDNPDWTTQPWSYSGSVSNNVLTMIFSISSSVNLMVELTGDGTFSFSDTLSFSGIRSANGQATNSDGSASIYVNTRITHADGSSDVKELPGIILGPVPFFQCSDPVVVQYSGNN